MAVLPKRIAGGWVISSRDTQVSSFCPLLELYAPGLLRANIIEEVNVVWPTAGTLGGGDTSINSVRNYVSLQIKLIYVVKQFV